jgi:uncharacterized membrane-anchored protein
MRKASRTAPFVAAVALLLLTSAAAPAQQPPQIPWVPGPTPIDLGPGVAQIDLGADYAFAGAQDTRRLMEMMGNHASNKEVGMIRPTSESEHWLIVFEYDKSGYVKDDDKDKIDADALLENFKQGTEAQNEIRKQKGIPAIHVVGWAEPPHYDERTHNLVWALHGNDDSGEEFVNYNVRLLGREGYMSVTLIEDYAKFHTSKPQVETVLASFDYKSGKRYGEYRSGDKVAEVGLAALIAGGAGVAAAKLGLFAVIGKFLAKSWKLVVVGVAALGAGIKKLLSGRSRDSQQA